MMDRDTLLQHEDFIVDGNGTTPTMPTNLTMEEVAAFIYCSENNWRFEQEKILQSFVNYAFAGLMNHSSGHVPNR